MALKICFFSDNCDIDLSGKQIRKKEFTFFADQIFSKNYLPIAILDKDLKNGATSEVWTGTYS